MWKFYVFTSTAEYKIQPCLIVNLNFNFQIRILHLPTPGHSTWSVLLKCLFSSIYFQKNLISLLPKMNK